jgi:post-segregation antitoxin (ccd killing protein)
MNKKDRKIQQEQRDINLKKQIRVKITKTDSLFERAKKLKIATDLPAINRRQRRIDLSKAVNTALKYL